LIGSGDLASEVTREPRSMFTTHEPGGAADLRRYCSTLPAMQVGSASPTKPLDSRGGRLRKSGRRFSSYRSAIWFSLSVATGGAVDWIPWFNLCLNITPKDIPIFGREGSDPLWGYVGLIMFGCGIFIRISTMLYTANGGPLSPQMSLCL
jgi:hypothetical protein